MGFVHFHYYFSFCFVVFIIGYTFTLSIRCLYISLGRALLFTYVCVELREMLLIASFLVYN